MFDRRTVLIVDDLPANLQILDEILSPRYKIKAAVDGVTALELVAQDRPDLVLLDVMMPVMDGLEVCRRLKSDPDTRHIPVIFVTAKGEAHDEEAGFSVGAEDYITKPIHPALVQARVKTHLELYERRQNLERLVEERTAQLREEFQQRSLALDSLAAAYDLLSGVMENFGEALASTNEDGHITFANSQLGLLAGIDQEGIHGRTLSEIFPDAPIEEAVSTAHTLNKQLSFEFSLHRAGKEILIGARVSPLIRDNKFQGMVLATRDITARRSMEEQLQQASRMATLGEMATGIAHEINQPLNVIRMASQMIHESIDEGETDLEFIQARSQKITKMVDRASKIINHLRTFGRRTTRERLNIAANQPIRQSLELVEEKLRLNSVQLDLDLDDNLPEIRGDSANLEQVFINLILNAVDAFESYVPEGSARKIRIRSFSNEDRTSVSYEITDNGPGIPGHVREKIFDPFFTTKEVGKGTGLGLSISFGIIEAHNGTIVVESAPSEGTLFRIEIPLPGSPLEKLEKLDEFTHSGNR